MKYLSLSIPGFGEINAPESVPTGGLSGPGTSPGENILQTAMELFVILGIVLALFTIIFAGIQWITSRGDKGKIETARLKITYSIVGLIIIFLAIIIVNIVGTGFGIDFFNFK